MSELLEKLRDEFQDSEYRHAYAEECLDIMIATQIKVLREQRDMTQSELAEAAGMKQPRIPLLEDKDYSNWTTKTLKRLAKVFDVALSVKFETFSHLVGEFENLSRATLQRPSFSNDPNFRRGSESRRVRPRNRFRIHHAKREAHTLLRHNTNAGIGGFAAEANSAAGTKKNPSGIQQLVNGPVISPSKDQRIAGGQYGG